MRGPWLVTFYLMAGTEKTVLIAFNSTALNSQPNKSTESHQILKDLNSEQSVQELEKNNKIHHCFCCCDDTQLIQEGSVKFIQL